MTSFEQAFNDMEAAAASTLKSATDLAKLARALQKAAHGCQVAYGLLMPALLLTVLLVLAGCAARQPAISDIRSDVVKVQTHHNILTANPSPQQIRAEAQRGCREYGNVVSHSLSTRCIQTDGYGYCMQREHLFACKPPDAIDPAIPDPTP